MSNNQMNAAYLDAVCQWAGVDNKSKDSKSTRVVFPCIQDTRAILAGSGVPDAITNRELSEKADALLSSNDLWYNPASKGKYSDFLSRYLDYVVFKDTDKAAQNLVNEKQGALTDASIAWRERKKTATDEWKADEDDDKGTLVEWTKLNYPEINSLRDTITQAEKEVAQARVATGVPQARQLNKYKEQFSKMEAIDEKSEAGLNMTCAAAQVFDIKNWVDKLRQNGFTTRVAEPTNTWLQPLFTLSDDYASQMDTYYKDFDSMGYDVNLDLNTSVGTEEAATKAGREITCVQSSIGFGWLRFSASHEETKEWKESESTRKETNTKVRISCKRKAVYNVTPGNKWDVPGFRTLFPYTKDGTPEAIKTLVRPTQLLCAVGVKYIVTFDDSVRKTFDTEYSKAESSGGRLSVFGLDIDAGHSPENTRNTTHKSTWDVKEGVLTVEPSNIAGCCTLLAVIGDMGEV